MSERLGTQLQSGGLEQSIHTGLLGKGMFAGASLDLNFAATKNIGPLVTFTRASSGTYVGSDGLIKTATTNLLLRSEDFSIGVVWPLSGSTLPTITANAGISPGGNATADLWTRTSTGASFISQAITKDATTIQYTFSIFVKQSVGNFCALRVQGAYPARADVVFNIATGAISNAAAAFGGFTAASASIIPYPNNWYRLTFTATSDTATSYQCIASFNSNNAVIDGIDSASNSAGFLWGAQLEQSSTVGEYIPTASTINSAPRFDHAITSSVTNLLLRSEEFDNASWAKLLSTVSANVNLAPNGSATADKLEEATGTGEHVVYQARTGSNETVVLSVFCKQAERTRVRIGFSNFATEGRGAIFDLASGSVVSTEASGTDYTNLSASIDAFSGGWYRCTFKATKGAVNTNNNPFIETVNGTSFSFAGTAGSGIYLWGAQLEQSANVGTYVPTTIAAATSNTTESLGLLVEEARTNLIFNSEDTSTWLAPTGITLTQNSIAAPSSAITADLYTEDTSTGLHVQDGPAFTFVTSTTYTYSVFVKAVGSRNFEIGFPPTQFTARFARFTLSGSGAVQGVDAGVTASVQALGNGWYRCAATSTCAVGAGARVGNFIIDASHVRSYTGNGSSGIYIWGAQLEAGSFPTSYIPTTTAAATRSADVASITGTNFSSWYNQTEGTVYFSAKTNFAVPSGPFPRVVQIQGATGSDKIEQSFFNGGQVCFVRNSAAIQAEWYPNYFIQNGVTSSFALATNNIAGSSNGVITGTDSVAVLPTVDRMIIGAETSFGNFLNGTIRRLTYWPTRLPNSTLQAITL